MTLQVLFYLLDGETNASSRHRALQYFPYLRQHGIQPAASPPVPESMYQRLVERGAGSLRAKAAFYSLFGVTRLLGVLRARRADVVVIQRDLFPFGPPVLERMLRRINPRLVYDTDDATYLRPGFTPDTPFQRLRRFDKVAEVVSHARWVSVATDPIAAWARQFSSNVSVVPMAVDPAEYDRVSRAPPTGSANPTVLGWAGTGGSLRYLESLAPVLREVAEKHPILVRAVSGAYGKLCLPGVPLDARPWRAESALEDLSTFDVGLVPLHDSPFERAKFPFKLLQYLALGVPSVSARIGVARDVVEHGRTGLLAETPDEWRDALQSLIADPVLRQRLAAAGRETVAANYTIPRVAPLLLEGLTRAALRT